MGRSNIKAGMLIICGMISLAVGGIGVLIPILPTTPFVLLAAVLFSASSPNLARALEKNRIFGPYIAHYRNKTGVPMKTKKEALIWLWISLSLSAAIIRKPFVLAILLVVGVSVSTHILLLKTRSERVDPAKAAEHHHAQNEQQQDA